MLFSCCCRGQKEAKKRKKNVSGDCPGSPSYQPSSIVFTPHSPIFTIQSQRSNNCVPSSSLSSEEFYYYQVGKILCYTGKQIYRIISNDLIPRRWWIVYDPLLQDVYLSSKDTLPPGSRDHVPRVSFSGVKTHGAGGQFNYIDISPLDNETINDKCVARTLPRRSDTGAPGKLPSKIFASPENFKLSVRSLSQSSRSIISSSPEFLRKHYIHHCLIKLLNWQCSIVQQLFALFELDLNRG